MDYATHLENLATKSDCKPEYSQRFELYNCSECTNVDCPHWAEYNED